MFNVFTHETGDCGTSANKGNISWPLVQACAFMISVLQFPFDKTMTVCVINDDVCSCVSCSHMTSVRLWRWTIRFSETTLLNFHEYSWLWIMLLKDTVSSCDNDIMGSYSNSWSVATPQEKNTLVCFFNFPMNDY